MWQSLWAKALSKLFGDGLGADIAGRGSVYLADEVRKALDKEPERLTSVRLRPGESYTVIARPPATREERHLAAAKAKLQARDDHLSRPTRRQLRTARKLRAAQRRLDRRSPGGRRYAKAVRAESERARAFDQVMTPTRRQARVHTHLESVTRRLDASREASMDRARAGVRRRPRRERSRVYD